MGDHSFGIAVLKKILDNYDDDRFRKLRKCIPQVLAYSEELGQIGFEDQGECFFLPHGDREILVEHYERLVSAADAMLDPDKISLAKVAEILERKGTLPGINEDIDDEPLMCGNLLVDETCRPRKPWE